MTHFRYMLKTYKSWRRGKRYEADLLITSCSDGTVRLALSLECADVLIVLSPDDAARLAELAPY